MLNMPILGRMHYFHFVFYLKREPLVITDMSVLQSPGL